MSELEPQSPQSGIEEFDFETIYKSVDLNDPEIKALELQLLQTRLEHARSDEERDFLTKIIEQVTNELSS